MMRYILHSSRRCPFCIRVRIMLYLKGIEHELVEEPIRKWTEWMKEYGKRTGERLQVPVLRIVLENGSERIYRESNLINEMLDGSFGKPEFTPAKDSSAHKEMLMWFSWCDEVLKPKIDLFKYGENLKFDKESLVGHTKALAEALFQLEATLTGKEYLLEERMTLADVAIIPFVRQIMRTREGEFDFSPFPNVKRWALSLLDRSWFTDVVMKKQS